MPERLLRFIILSTWVGAAMLVAVVLAPVAAQTGPVNGMRPSEPRAHAIVDATVITAPGQRIEHATILIRKGLIEQVGPADKIRVPDDARVWPSDGLTIYPGLIESALLIAADFTRGAGSHWNDRIHPELSMSEQPGPDAALRKDMRALGFTAAAVYPSSGAIRGSGVVLALADQQEHVTAYRDRAAMALAFDFGGGGPPGAGRRRPAEGETPQRSAYPGSLMGAIALLRQTLYDAQWRQQCRRVWRDYPTLNETPIRADALDALGAVIADADKQQVLFEVSDELNAIRAAKLAREFNLDVVLLASGTEFRRLNEVTATGLPIILPLDFPKRPDVSTDSLADSVSLRDLMTWEQAPTNPRRLIGAMPDKIALTTHKLKSRQDFPSNLRIAIKHGLTEDQALASLTTTPAKLLGLDSVLGTIAIGKAANLVVVKGSLFNKDGKIIDTWVNGRRCEVYKEPQVQLVGNGTLKVNLAPNAGPDEIAAGDRGRSGSPQEIPIEIDTTKSKVDLRLPDDKKAAAKKVIVQQDQLSFVVDGRPFNVEGYVRLSGVMEGSLVSGTGVLPDGSSFPFEIIITKKETPSTAPDEAKPDDDEKADDSAQQDRPEGRGPRGRREGAGGGGGSGTMGGRARGDKSDEDAPFIAPPEELTLPLGEYGRISPPVAPSVVVVQNATIWTCGPQGIIRNGWLVVENGKVLSIGAGKFIPLPSIPNDMVTIDAHGKHITLGIIDCHSHTGISGSVNEFAQTNTAECRIGDVIDPDAINWYRQLAGGVVAVNQLHGSANPIGGQNSVVKIKWGSPVDDFPIKEAIPGIKFALGENVKRSTGRYPNTRMGVETFIRDAFTAARDYKSKWDRYRGLSEDAQAMTMPPQRDLELDALVEILDHQRIIHCHSYRQDEILMLIRLADAFGFTIGTFQHVLEGYKVADAIAKHGAGGSTFSDWWAYKVEVMDAIPYNGALMSKVGVLTSFNSDSDEMARRLNTEAAKAVRYGGLSPEEALKFVTINPAKQLRIDKHMGSLEVGKDADFVIWSGDPLSPYTRCEQTWIDGAKYFDIEDDLKAREQIKAERTRIINKILIQTHGELPKKGAETQPSTAPDESSSQPQTKPEVPPQFAGVQLTAEQSAWLEEQARLGRDPHEVHPGDCGCSHSDLHNHE